VGYYYACWVEDQHNYDDGRPAVSVYERCDGRRRVRNGGGAGRSGPQPGGGSLTRSPKLGWLLVAVIGGALALAGSAQAAVPSKRTDMLNVATAAYDSAVRSGDPAAAGASLHALARMLRSTKAAVAGVERTNSARVRRLIGDQITLYDRRDPDVQKAYATLGELPADWLAALRRHHLKISIGARPIGTFGYPWNGLPPELFDNAAALFVAPAGYPPRIAVDVTLADPQLAIWHEATHALAAWRGWNHAPELLRVWRAERSISTHWQGTCDPGPCEMLAESVEFWVLGGRSDVANVYFDAAYARWLSGLFR
jgi:hypothetical protein